MNEKEQLLKALEYYRNFVDSLRVLYPTVSATVEAEERYIFENLPPDIADLVQTAWMSMTETQKLAVATLTQHSRADAGYAGAARVIQKLNRVQISIEGIALPESPYGEDILLDWDRRSNGEEWFEEDLRPRYKALLDS